MSTTHLGQLYADGEEVVRQGEVGECMFAVQKGQLEVLKSADGVQVRVAVLAEGDIFGEMAIFDREMRSATVRALGPARVLTIDRKGFLRRVHEDPSLAFNLLQTMSRRIRNLNQNVAHLSSHHDAVLPTRPPRTDPIEVTEPSQPARKAESLVPSPTRPALPTGTALEMALISPQQEARTPPCNVACASGSDVRGWIALAAQRVKLGLTDEEACTQAWKIITAVNPFPATIGRICPHPCETACNRSGKDAAVSINALERFIGDWGLSQGLKLEQAIEPDCKESIGVIGAGPSGLAFAHQMARRGYEVTVYEKQERPGGMLHFGIPQYRLPEEVLQAEISRILDLGVQLRVNTAVGRDLSMQQLSDKHDALFVGIGAGVGLKLGIPGEGGPGMWTGTEFLAALNRGDSVQVGRRVIVVGGGNTAMDAARAARRLGAQVTVLYRRTRTEMPAIESEIEDALAEGVDFMYLAAPLEIERRGDVIEAVWVQRMAMGEPDASGRRAPIPIAGARYDLRADTVIAAVSQQPDPEGLEAVCAGKVWFEAQPGARLGKALWSGGDATGLGFAGIAIAQGRNAAEAAHASLRGLPLPQAQEKAAHADAAPKLDFYAPADRAVPPVQAVLARLAEPDLEVRRTIGAQQFFEEAARCFSCGACFGCEHCQMFCNAGGFTRLQEPAPGKYYSLSTVNCESCGKCVEVCPSGYVSVRAATPVVSSA